MKKIMAFALILILVFVSGTVKATSASNQITVNTNQRDYTPGDSVTINGMVKKDGKVLSNVDVTFRLEYEGTILMVDQTKTENKEYRFIFGLAKDAKVGNYKVIVQSLGMTKESIIQVIKSSTTGGTTTSPSSSTGTTPTSSAGKAPTTSTGTSKLKYKVYNYKNPTVIKGEVMIPYNIILKDLGTTYKYDKKKKAISAKKAKINLVLTLNKNSAKLDGKTKKLTVSPVLKGGIVMVPAGFVAKTFGAKVEWDKNKKVYKVSVPWK